MVFFEVIIYLKTPKMKTIRISAISFLFLVNIASAQVNDVGVSDIIVPEIGVDVFTDSYTVQVQVTNYGSAYQSNIPIVMEVTPSFTSTTIINETIGSINAGSTVTYYFSTSIDLSTPGEYDLEIYTQLGTDENIGNDGVLRTVLKASPTKLPVDEDFEGMGPFTQQYQVPKADIDGLSGFSYIPEVVNASRLRFNYGQANSGTYSIGLDTDSNPSGRVKNDIYLTIDGSQIDLYGDPVWLNFVYRDFSDENDDNDKVFLRGSENDDWFILFDWGAQGTSGWQQVSGINISQALINEGQSFSSSTQIRWGQKDNVTLTADGLGIDDIQVFQYYDDLAVSGFIQSPAVADAVKTLEIDIRNNGINDQSGFDVTLEVTNPSNVTTIVTETFAGTITPGEVATMQFVTPFDLSAIGEYDLVAYVSLFGDEKVDNDLINPDLFVVSSYTGGLPLLEGFESTSLNQFDRFEEITGAPGFFHINEGQGIVRTCTICGVYGSGNRSLYLNAWSGGAPYISYAVLSVDLSSYSILSDEIGMAFIFNGREAYYDEALKYRKVFIRGSDTDDWLEVYDWDADLLESQYVEIFDLELTPVLQNGGQEFSATTQIKIGYGENGWSPLVLDDIEVYEFPDNDLAVVDVILPDPDFLTDGESITVEVLNRGLNSQSVYDVQIEVEDTDGIQSFVTESVNIPIGFKESTLYTFSSSFDFSKEGEYTVTGMAILIGDENNANDSYEAETGHFQSYTGGLPYFQDFESINSIVDNSRFNEIVGADGYNYVNDPNHKNELQTSGGQYISGNRSLEIGREIFDNLHETSNIYLTADLSSYDALEDEIAIRFHFFYDFGSSTTGQDDRQVFIRGSKDDIWIELFDWYNNASDREWILNYAENISANLRENGQNFSSTFQVRFGHNQRSSWEFVVDDIYLYEIPESDLRITDVRGPDNAGELTSNQSFEVDIKNEGLSPQSLFNLDVKLYRDDILIRQTQDFIAGPIGPGDILTQELSGLGLDLSQPGSYELIVSPVLPEDAEPDFDEGKYSIVNISTYQGDLPYFQDFEAATVDVIDQQSSPIDVFEGFSYDFDESDQGEVFLRLNTYDHFGGPSAMAFGDNEKSLGLHNAIHNFINTQEAVLTIDMSEYAVNEDVLIMDYYFWLGYNYTSNSKSYVRGNINDEWIEVRNHYNPYTNISWNPVIGINISQTLQAEGQEFSSTFQVKFEHDSRYFNNYVYSFLVDNISIYNELWGRDLDITYENSGVGENAGLGTMVGTLYPLGDVPGNFSFALVNGDGDDNNDNFYLDGDKLKVLSNDFDFETSGTASVRVALSNNDGYTITKILSIPVVDQNDAPDLDDQVVGTVAEADPQFTVVGTITSGTDVDVPAQTLTYEIVGESAFAIDPNTGQITIDDPDQLDFETKPTEIITIKVTDDGVPNLSGTGEITINISDSNDPPTVPDQYLTMDRAVANTASLGFVDAFDEDDGQTVSFALELGHSGVFAIDPVSGEITVADNTTVGGSTTSIYPVNVEVTDDAGIPLTTTFTLNVYVNDGSPSIQATYSFDKEENSVDNFIGQVNGTDPNPDQTVSYSITLGNTDGIFLINSETGDIYISDQDLFDFETDDTHVLEVEISDGGFPEGTATTTVTINVLDTNDSPDIGASDLSVDENTAVGTVIGTFNVSDEDSGQDASFELTDDASGVFTLDGTNGELTINESPDYESTSTYTIEITATDDSGDALETTKSVVISINDLNEAPVVSDVSFTLEESSQSGSAVGTLTASDPDDGQMLTFAITSDASGLFQINETTGFIGLSDGGLDFETSSSIDLEVTVTDNGTGELSSTATVTINVTDVNERPDIDVQDFAVANTIANGDVIQTLSASDPDGGQTLSYEIVSGTNLEIFNLDESTGELSITDIEAFFGTSSQYALTVRVTDDGSPQLVGQTSFIVNTDIVTPIVSDQTVIVSENETINTLIGQIEVLTTPGSTVTYTINSGNDDGFFAVNSAGIITVAAEGLDFETTSSYSLNITIAYSDAPSNSSDFIVTINVENENESPFVVSGIDTWELMVGDTDLTRDLNGNFDDIDADDQLTIRVKEKGRASLPDWLSLSDGILTADISNNDAGEYTMEVIAQDNGNLIVKTEFDVVVSPILSIDPVVNNTLIYPNPTSEHFYIKGVDQGEISIISVSGKVVKKMMIKTLNQRIDVSDLKVGTYLININDGPIFLRLIKN